MHNEIDLVADAGDNMNSQRSSQVQVGRFRPPAMCFTQVFNEFEDFNGAVLYRRVYSVLRRITLVPGTR